MVWPTLGSRTSKEQICRGQMSLWIKMLLSMEVDLGPGDFVLDGDPAPSKKGAEPPPQPWNHLYYGQTAGCIKMPLGKGKGKGKCKGWVLI